MTSAAILLVEDNVDDVDLTLRAFRQHGVQNPVVVASDGEEALSRLLPDHEPPLNPAVVLLDLNLPRLNGLEVLQRIRSDPRTTLLPVVVLTTSHEERDLVESYRLGANSYVQKPVAFADFLEAVRLLGLYWLLLNEPPPSGSVAR